MLGNGLLAFSVILIVVVFSYMSLKLSQDKKTKRTYAESFRIELAEGLQGENIAIHINDSIVFKGIISHPLKLEIGKFADKSALAVENLNNGETLWYDLNDRGGRYKLNKQDGVVHITKVEE